MKKLLLLLISFAVTTTTVFSASESFIPESKIQERLSQEKGVKFVKQPIKDKATVVSSTKADNKVGDSRDVSCRNKQSGMRVNVAFANKKVKKEARESVKIKTWCAVFKRSGNSVIPTPVSPTDMQANGVAAKVLIPKPETWMTTISEGVKKAKASFSFSKGSTPGSKKTDNATLPQTGGCPLSTEVLTFVMMLDGKTIAWYCDNKRMDKKGLGGNNEDRIDTIGNQGRNDTPIDNSGGTPPYENTKSKEQILKEAGVGGSAQDAMAGYGGQQSYDGAQQYSQDGQYGLGDNGQYTPSGAVSGSESPIAIGSESTEECDPWLDENCGAVDEFSDSYGDDTLYGGSGNGDLSAGTAQAPDTPFSDDSSVLEPIDTSYAGTRYAQYASAQDTTYTNGFDGGDTGLVTEFVGWDSSDFIYDIGDFSDEEVVKFDAWGNVFIKSGLQPVELAHASPGVKKRFDIYMSMRYPSNFGVNLNSNWVDNSQKQEDGFLYKYLVRWWWEPLGNVRSLWKPDEPSQPFINNAPGGEQ